MAVRLYNLRNVPDDEAEEMRELLKARGVDFYETPPGRWGLSAAAFWLRSSADLPAASALLQEYQRQRGERARREHETAIREGRAERFRDRLRQRPWLVLGYLALTLIILAIFLAPVVQLMP